MFWAVIRCNLRDPSQRAAFNAWYDGEHAPRYIAQPGFVRGWRLELVEHPSARGDRGQHYMAVYETETVTAFNDALDRDMMASHPWEGWEERIQDWQRTYYRELLRFGARDVPPAPQGRYWTFVRVDLEASSADEERDFNAWYDERHVPEVTAFAGFRRAWRFRLEPDRNDLGERGQRYLAVYETDDADYLPRVRQGTKPWDGIWADKIRNWEIAMYRKIYDHEGGGSLG